MCQNVEHVIVAELAPSLFEAEASKIGLDRFLKSLGIPTAGDFPPGVHNLESIDTRLAV